MAEDLTLDNPVEVDPGATKFRVTLVHMDWEAQQIILRLREVNAGAIVEDGKTVSHTYSGTDATSLMVALNKVNLSTKSLHRRIIERLQADGVLGTGTISGTPD
jgi:hypothetical protein